MKMFQELFNRDVNWELPGGRGVVLTVKLGGVEVFHKHVETLR